MLSPLLCAGVRIAAAACAVCAAVALCVVVSGERRSVRAELGFGFPSAPRELADAGVIAAHNGRYAAAVLTACLAVSWTPALRPLLDTALAALLGFNAAVIGVALGAYGPRLAAAIALHGTLELAGFAIAGGAYLRARRDELARSELARAACLALGLVCAAALVEAWVAPGART